MSDLTFEERNRLESEVLPTVVDDPECAALSIVILEKQLAEARAELTRIREALTHNCDKSGCPSVGPHIVGDIPPHKASLYQETIHAQRELLAEAQARIAELEAELADAQKTISEMQTATNILADAGINTLKSNAKLQARAEKAEAERDAARAEVEEVKGKLEVAAEWLRDYGVELCAGCGRWFDMGYMITGEDGGPYCYDCYESWRFECPRKGCTYRMAEMEDGADTRCPECGEVMVERGVKEGDNAQGQGGGGNAL